MRGGTITDCWTESMAVGTLEVGGLVGSNDLAKINQLHSSGSVNGSYRVGGLVGSNAGAIRDCYAIAAVSGTEMTGGLVGLNEDVTLSGMDSVPCADHRQLLCSREGHRKRSDRGPRRTSR